MAGRGKNEVTLTFAGDSDALERASKQAQSSTQKLATAFDEVSAAAKRSDQAMAGIDASTSRLSQIAGRGGADFRAYRSDLDGVGDGFNDLEDRAMGAGNLINGFSDVMKGGSQGTAQFAMGLSDLAAGTRYTLVPSLQDGVKSVKGVIDGMKQGGGVVGMFKRNLALVGTAAVGATAAIGLVTMALQDQAQRAEESRQRIQKYTERLKELHGNSGKLSQELLVTDERFQFLRDTLKESDTAVADFAGSIRDGTFDVGAMSRELGLTRAETLALAIQTTEMETEVGRASEAFAANEEAARGTERSAEDLAAAYESAEEAVTGFYEAQKAAVDPLFAFTTAARDNQEAIAAEAQAQEDLNAAIAEHGPNSVEAAAAARDLEAAHQEVITSAQDLRAAEGELDGALQDGRISMEELDGILGTLEASGYTSAGAMDWLRGKIEALPSRTVTIAVRDEATGAVEQIKSRLDGMLLSYRIPVRVTGEAQQSFGGRQAGGGVVPSYFAAGGINWDPGMGPRGTDTVPAWLTPGEMVLSNSQQADLWRMINGGGSRGGGTVRLVIDSGSNPVDRMLADMLRRIVRVEHGGDVQAALGYSR